MLCVLFFILVDVFSSDIWQELSTYDTPELARLAASIRLYAARQTAQPRSAWLHFVIGWAQQQSFQVFPVKESQLVLSMQSLVESAGSKSAIEETFNAIVWAHAIGNCHSPT